MYGEIAHHPKYGFQFNVSDSERIKPDDKDGIIEPLYDRILGRYTNKKVLHPESKEVICEKDTYITEQIADEELSLPISPTMTIKEAEYVVKIINDWRL